ncbi:MAG: AAA family ATPase [Oligoflexia bacterium]|nr:AAA family ATPase [Oligoflexia bacterium]
MSKNKFKYFFIAIFIFTHIFLSSSFSSDSNDQKKTDKKKILATEEGLKNLSIEMRKKYSEMDGYIDVLLLAILSKQHVLSLGGPGGSKTQTADDVLKTLKGKLFNLQFSANTKQEKIIGAIIGKEFLSSGKINYQTEQSLLMHDYAILDEIDKANTEVLASALSVLLERKGMLGDKEIIGKLKSALITSNMTIYEFLEKFKNSNDLSTGMALLDRILFKVLVVNRLSSAEALFKVMSNCKNKKQCFFINNLDLNLLQEQINMIKVPDEIIKLSAHLWMQLAQRLEKKQKEDEETCKEDPKSMLYPYTMTNQFTNRGAISNLIDTLKTAKYLQLLQSKKEESNRRELLNLENVCLTPEDLLLTQYQMIIQGPDKLAPGTPENPNNCPSGKLLAQIKNQYKHNPRTLKMINDLIFERDSFAKVYLEILKIYQNELKIFDLQTLLSQDHDLSNLNEDDKKMIYYKIAKMKDLINKRRLEEFPNGETAEGVSEVAREKVLQELTKLENSLEQNSSSKEKEIIENVQKKISEEKIKEQENENKKRKELEERISKIKKENPAIIKGELIYTIAEDTSISSIKFNPTSDKEFVTIPDATNPTVWRFNSIQNKWISTKLLGHQDGRILDVNYSPDGTQIVTASNDGSAMVWNNLNTNTQSSSSSAAASTLADHKAIVVTAEFSPDSKQIVTSSYDNTARVWTFNQNTKKWESVVLDQHTDWVVAATFNPTNPNQILTASTDKSAIIWELDTNTNQWKNIIQLKGHNNEIIMAKFSPDGKHIVTISKIDNLIKIWSKDSLTKKWPLISTTFNGPKQTITSVNFSADSTKLVVSSNDRTAITYNLNSVTNKWFAHKELIGHKQWVKDARFSSNGNQVISASLDGQARVWNLHSEIDNLKSIVIDPHQRSLKHASFNFDNTQIFTSGVDHSIQIWKVIYD